MAAHSKLTADVQAKLIEAIALGAQFEIACWFAGIHYATFRRWLVAAENGDERYVPLFVEIKKAEGTAATRWLGTINGASVKNWQAAAWLLERRYPRRYGRSANDFGAQKHDEDVEAAKVDMGSRDDVIKQLRAQVPMDVLREAANPPKAKAS
jgi:hypothetical protein